MYRMKLIRCAVIACVAVALPTVILFGSTANNTLVIARPVDALSIDTMLDTTSAGTWVFANINEPLIDLNHELEYEPLLATSWEFVEPTRLRFNLRQGITFHDGTPFDAHAVKFTFDRGLFGEPKAQWASLGASVITGVEIVDDYTIDILTDAPFGPLLRVMSMRYLGIVSPAAVEKYGEEYGRHPSGTGPFKFVEWRTNDRIVLEANEDYWQGRPALDKVVFRVIPEESSRMASLRTGEVDLVMKPSPAELPAFAGDSDFAVYETPGLSVFFIAFNLDYPPMDDIRVRHAIAHAIDRESIMEHVLEGAAAPASTSILAPGVFGFYGQDIDQQYPYDKKKAIELLSEAGWIDQDGDGVLEKNGKDLVLPALPCNGRFLRDLDVAEVVEAQLREIGIRIELQVFEWATVFSKLRSADFPYALMTVAWNTTTVDADYTFYALFNSAGVPPDGWNLFRYSNAEVDDLIHLGQITVDQDKRAAIYARAEAILAADAPYVSVYVNKNVSVANANLKGFRLHPVEYNLILYPVHF